MSHIGSEKPEFVPFDTTQDVKNIRRASIELHFLGRHWKTVTTNRQFVIAIMHRMSQNMSLRKWLPQIEHFRYHVVPQVDGAQDPIDRVASNAIHGQLPDQLVNTVTESYDRNKSHPQVVKLNDPPSLTIYYSVDKPPSQFTQVNTAPFYKDENNNLFTEEQMFKIANSHVIFKHSETQSTQIDLQGNCSESNTQANYRKNRYENVRPCNASRVKKADDRDWYINASHIEKGYIAAQGPLPGTKTDFYDMLFLTNPNKKEWQTVVTVVNPVENNRPKCEEWWPTSADSSKICGNYTATLVQEKLNLNTTGTAHLVTRTIEIKNTTTQETRTITQQHIENWPDSGVINSALLDEVLEAMPSNPASPTIIHCSAGIGRTGVVTLTHMLRPYIKADMSATDIQNLVYNKLIEIREKRPGMVQTEEQYELILRNLFQYQNRLK